MILKCKICGGSLAFQPGDRIATCEYCGRQQTMPSLIDDGKVARMYDRANGYRMANEFDRAAHLYEQIIVESPMDCEAYWNLALCEYGIVYVKGPASQEYVPTCNRLHYQSILNDENYKKALEFGTPEQRVFYIRDAEYIDEVQSKIVSIAKKEKPFDIFICYKETTDNGSRTRDSIKAQELYDLLTEQGYKVFFSRITLESKVGSEYEPYIYAALASSKVMLHVTSSKENSESPWVRNEWSRYMSLAGKDSSKNLIPLYFDMEKGDLPDEFAHLPSFNMEEEGFQQELVRGIRKMIPTPVMKAEQRKKRNKLLKRIGIGAAVCAVIAGIIMYPQIKENAEYKAEYDAAMQLYYDHNYPEATWAFDALGDVKDAKEMKEKAALSWRKSLATVACESDFDGGGQYYINENGTVENLNSGTGNDNTGLDEHGKVVSIEDAPIGLLALHEDGYADNIQESGADSEPSKWDNVVQISPVFNTTCVGLLSDGRVVFGKTDNDLNPQDDDHWVEGVSEWKDIYSFASAIGNRYGYGGIEGGIIIGVKADGSLCHVAQDHFTEDISSLLSNFSNVQKVAVEIEETDGDSYSINVIALTRDSRLQLYSNGEYEELDATDIADVDLAYSYDYEKTIAYTLIRDGVFSVMSSAVPLVEDAVYCKNGFIITRTGSVWYGWEYSGIEAQNAKACVFDEWTERLD